MEIKRSGGIGFFGLLQIVFITLKLLKLIDWSWWLVFSPSLAWLALLIVALIIVIWL